MRRSDAEDQDPDDEAQADGQRSAKGTLGLARLNLASGDLTAALRCAREAAERVLGDEAQADLLPRLLRLLEELRGRAAVLGPAVVAELDALLTRVPRGKTAPARTTPGPATESELVAARPLVPPELLSLLRALGPGPGPRGLPLQAALGRLLAAGLDLDPTLDLALELVVLATGAARGCLVARDAHGRLTHERGRALGTAELAPALSTTVLAEVERTRRPVVVKDARSDPRFDEAESLADRDVRAVACVPILAPGLGARTEPILGAVYLEEPKLAGVTGPDDTAAALVELAGLVAGPIARAQRFDAERRALQAARAELRGRRTAGPLFVGKSPALRAALDLLVKVAPEDVTVRIEGESGTGKELAARLLHQRGRRAAGPFVAESCASIAEQLLEAELFGVTKGAYTGADADRPGLFERADGGTLFLDEIGELSPTCQAKLLRVLEERSVRRLGAEETRSIDVRVVVATHRDLPAMVQEGTFRADLFHRLDVVRVKLPPLRDRREDIPLLVEHLSDELADELGAPPPRLSPHTLARLASHDWPGNVRELRNVVVRLVVAGDDGAPWLEGGRATPAPAQRGPIGSVFDLPPAGPIPSLRDARQQFDREYVAAVLARHDGNVTRAAEALGMQRPHLSRLVSKLGLRKS